MIKKTLTLLGVALGFFIFLFFVCCLRFEEGDTTAVTLIWRDGEAIPTLCVTLDTSLTEGVQEGAHIVKEATNALPSALTEPFAAVFSRIGRAIGELASILRGERQPEGAEFVLLPSAYSPVPSHTMYGHG